MFRSVLLSLALVMLTFGVFWEVTGHGFISLDDQGYVVSNPEIRGGLTWAGMRWALTATHGANWHPLTWVSHMADLQAFGMNAGAHHAVNLMLHAANVALLFLVLSRLSGAFWRSALVAALFAVHPLHVESVAWVAERKDVLSTFFLFVAMGGYLRHARRPGRGSLAATFVACALGLMAKPMLVTAPFVLLLLDWWPLARWGPGAGDTSCGGLFGLLPPARLWREKIPLFVLAAASSWMTWRAQSGLGATASWELLTIPARLANAAVSYVSYLGKTIWPANLSVFYPHPIALPTWTKLALMSFVLAGITLVALGSRVRRPYLPVGWFWYLGMLVPVIGLVQVGSQAMADRYTYVPLVGVFLAGTWGVSAITERRPRLRPPAVFAALAVLSLLAAAARGQAGYWQDSGTLFGRALEVNPTNYVAHYHLGLLSAAQGDTVGAGKHYLEALHSKPDYAEANVRLAEIFASRGQIAEAVDRYRAALRADPRAVEVHNNLGVALIQQGDVDGAVAEFRAALQRDPGYADARFNLGKAQALQGNIAAAAAQFRALAASGPADAQVLLELGDAYLLMDSPAAARAAYQRAREVNPSLKGSPYCMERGSSWCGLLGDQREKRFSP